MAERFGPDELVTINVTDLALAEVAALVSTVLRDPMAIPAEKALQPITLNLKDVPLTTVVEQLGLMRL